MGISYSAYSKYHTCPRMYDLHYNHRLRPVKKGLPMILGSVVDEALNKLLLEGTVEVSVKDVQPSTLEFKPTDIDLELIPPEVKEAILTRAQVRGFSGTDPDALMKAVIDAYLNGQELTDNQVETFETTVRAAMYHKALVIVETYKQVILPTLGEVSAVQKEVENGFIDMIAELPGEGKCVVDHKTSGRYYADDSVEMSPQLAKYCLETGISKAAFIVMSTNIRKNRHKTCLSCGHTATSGHTTCNAEVEGKRCHGEWEVTINPVCDTQTLTNEMPERMLSMTKESFEETEKAIAGEHFPANLNACNWVYGKRCPYFNYCHKGDATGLEVSSEAKESK